MLLLFIYYLFIIFFYIFDWSFLHFKPKWGYLPLKKPYYSNNTLWKTKVCRFCMHQVTKLKQGKVNCISKYCPLDLFSGDPQRIKLAVSNLMETPQNNFSVWWSCRLGGNKGFFFFFFLSMICYSYSPYYLTSKIVDEFDSQELVQMLRKFYGLPHKQYFLLLVLLKLEKKNQNSNANYFST